MFCCFHVLLYQWNTVFADSDSSFYKLIGKTGWQVLVKDVTIGLKHNDIKFELRMGDEHHFSFRAYQGPNRYQNRLGPLQARYIPQLSGMLDHGLSFLDQEQKGPSTMALHWFSYPESIKNWALTWQDSDLKKNWEQIDSYKRYDKLMGMISESLKKDFGPIIQDLGFDITGASMEKMGYPKAGTLEFYKSILKPADISSELKIPLPLMLSLSLKPLLNSTIQKSNNYELNLYSIDSFFVTATQDKSKVYCSFQGGLGKYLITGDYRLADGSYETLLPFSDPRYQNTASRLLTASLKSTKADAKAPVSLEIRIQDYSNVYQEMVTHFTSKQASQLNSSVQRSQLQNFKFYLFSPSDKTDFKTSLKPFLNQAGLKFKHFQVSLSNKEKASQYYEYETLLKPMGFKPDDTPAIPVLVYMIVEAL